MRTGSSTHWRHQVTVGVLVASGLLRAGPVLAQLEAQPDFERKRQEGLEQPAPPQVQSPVLLQRVDPIFPPEALRLQHGGVVLLRITVAEGGWVQRVEVEQSAGADLDWAAMGAASGFVFQPASVDGQAVPAVLLFKQSFTWTAPAPAPVVEPEPEGSTPDPEPPPVRFRGVVREAGSKRALPEAEVSVRAGDGEPVVVTADGSGRFEVRGLPTGEALVKVAHPEHETFTTVEEFAHDDVVEAAYYLPRRSYNRFETVVRDRAFQREVTRVAVRREEVNRVPGTMGDPLRAIELLPSMAQTPLLGGQLLVRGTPPRSTAVYLDGVQIPQLYHFGMLRSVIHPEFLESIDVYPGGFGPQYSRATAGVVDVRSRNLTMDHYRGQADMSFLESGFFFGGPVRFPGARDTDGPDPRRLSFAFAARRSWLDAFIPLALEFINPGQAGSATFAPVYADYQAKLEYRPSAAHTFQAMAFGSDDQITFRFALPEERLDARMRFQLTFHRLVGRWRWNLHPRMINEAVVHVGVDAALIRLTTGLGLEGLKDTDNTFDMQMTNRAPVLGVRNSLRYDVDRWLSFTLGVDSSLAFPRLALFILSRSSTLEPAPPTPAEAAPESDADPHEVRSTLPVRSTMSAAQEQRYNVNLGSYLQAVVEPIPGLKLLPGFRLDYMVYGSESRAVAPMPRFTARWEPVRHTVLKATTGLYLQAPRAYESSNLTGNPSLQPEQSWQTTVGLEQRITPFMTVGINAFVNLRQDLIQTMAMPINVDVDLGLSMFADHFDNQSVGRVYGMDLLWRHEVTKHLYGWVAYTLSRSEVMHPPDRWWRPFNFDQTHILSVVGQYRVPWHLPFREWARSGRLPRGPLWNTGWSILCGDLSLGARFRYVTGNPQHYLEDALVSSTQVQDDAETPRVQPPPDGKRHKPFHQLDLRVDYKMSFNLWLATLSLDILNVYNAKADQDDIPRIPFLPVASFSAEF